MTKNISPHVHIYKFPVTALSSITNRVTGVYLTGLFIGCGVYQFSDKNDLTKKYQEIQNPYKRLFNYSIIFPATYHTLGGLRHFVWDKFPKFLNNKSVSRSSFALIGFSGISTILQEYIFN